MIVMISIDQIEESYNLSPEKKKLCFQPNEARALSLSMDVLDVKGVK